MWAHREPGYENQSWRSAGRSPKVNVPMMNVFCFRFITRSQEEEQELVVSGLRAAVATECVA
jgi:hypothetical protein